MVKGPGLYTDMGKKARELLYEDYRVDHKFTTTIYSPTGIAIASSGTNKADIFLALVNTKLGGNTIAEVKVDTNSNLSTTIVVDEPAPGLKAILSFKIPDQRFSKLELQYLHDYVGIRTSIGLTAHPVVNFSGMVGIDGRADGIDVSFDTKAGKFTRFSLGLNFSSADLSAAMTLNSSKGGTLNASYCHIVNPVTNTAVGAEVNHFFAINETIFTAGAQHTLDPLTTVKARINNLGLVSAVIRHEWRPKSLITISGDVDTGAIVNSAKFGLALDFTPLRTCLVLVIVGFSWVEHDILTKMLNVLEEQTI